MKILAIIIMLTLTGCATGKVYHPKDQMGIGWGWAEFTDFNNITQG